MLVRKSVGVFVVVCSAAAHAQELPLRPLPAADLPIQPSVAPMSTATTVNADATALPIQPMWTLRAGDTIGRNLRAWADKAGWYVEWQLSKDWVVPNTHSFSGSFPDAVENVVKTLADNGALIRARIFDGNKTVVISGPGVTQQ